MNATNPQFIVCQRGQIDFIKKQSTRSTYVHQFNQISVRHQPKRFISCMCLLYQRFDLEIAMENIQASHKYTFLALLVIATLACTPNNQIAQLTTGIVSLEIPINTNSNQAYTYQSYNLTVPRRNQRNSQVSYSFAIKDAQAVMSNIMYFDLLVLQTYDTSLIVNFIYQPNKWTKVSYNYLLSYRSDFFAGLQTYLDKQFTKLQKGYRLQSGISIDQKNIKDSEFVVIAFLNGIRYSSTTQNNNGDHHLSFAFTEQYLQNSAIVLGFDGYSVGDIVSLTFSYIVYAPNMVKLGSYGGTINEYQFKGKSSKNIHYLFPYYNFLSLYGISALKTSNRNESSFSLQTELGQDYSFVYQINEWESLKYLQLTYIVLGVMPSTICQKVKECQAAGNVYIYLQTCVSSCPKTTRPVTYIDGAIECQQCPPNQSYSNSSGNCECNQGFIADSNKNCLQVSRKIASGVTNARQNNADQLDQQTTLPSLDGCLTLDNIQQSNKNLFVKLKASQLTLSDPRSDDKNFIKIIFEDSSKAANSYYCNRCSIQTQYYECLLLFAANIPRGQFAMHFQSSLTVGGKSRLCELIVPYQLSRSNRNK